MLALAGLVGLASAMAPAAASACSCIGREPSALVSDAAIIFEGMVREITPRDGQLEIRFEVTQSWRQVETEEIVIYTAALESACGVPFQLERGYIVLARRQDGRVVTGLCDGTEAAEHASELRRELGSGVIPVEIEDPEPEAEARSPRRAAPARGGCASCSVQAPRSAPLGLIVGFFLLVGRALRRRR